LLNYVELFIDKYGDRLTIFGYQDNEDD